MDRHPVVLEERVEALAVGGAVVAKLVANGFAAKSMSTAKNAKMLESVAYT
jgi:hypothetical protein